MDYWQQEFGMWLIVLNAGFGTKNVSEFLTPDL